MKELLYNTLNTICPNKVFLQGTLDSAEAYPESFITFFTSTTDDNAHYNNNTHSVDWHFSVIYYSSDPLTIDAVAEEIRTALKAQGFISQGKGSDIPSDKPTHTGWAMDFVITEYITNN